MNNTIKQNSGNAMTKQISAVRSLIAAFAAIALLLAQGVTTPASAGQAHGGQFVRIGLNKSVVVRLPANAQDVLIGNPAIVEAVVRTQRTAYLFAKKPGQTNAFFFDKHGRQILNLDIEVARDMKALKKLLQRVIPGNRITVETVGENIVLGGVAKNPAQAKLAFDLAAKYTNDDKKVLTTIAVAGKEQVMLKVKVTEMQREVLKQFGINAAAVERIGNTTLQIFSGNPFSVAGGALSNTMFGIGQLPGQRQIDVGPPTQTNGILRAMERDGFIRVLAEPNLTAISGEAAKFLAGGEFPIITSRTDEGVSIEYKPFGVGVGFTPVVLSHGRISLKLNTEVSDISPDNSVTIGTTTVPAFEVRRAETTVELPSGGSLALAGMIRENTKQAINGIPGAKKLPILGALFRSRDYSSKRTELVIIVTPYIVKPVSERQLVTPVDRAIVASDTQAILFGRLNRVFGTKNTTKRTYHGNVGFIVE